MDKVTTTVAVARGRSSLSYALASRSDTAQRYAS